MNRTKQNIIRVSVLILVNLGATAFLATWTKLCRQNTRGMQERHDAGALTIAQNVASCVVYGMPKEAVRHGGVRHVLGFDKIPGEIVNYGKDD